MTGAVITPVVGEVWKRREGRERVRIGRVWDICGCDGPMMHGVRPEHDAEPDTMVRCHPLHGGKGWFTVVPEFLARFDRIDADPSREAGTP